MSIKMSAYDQFLLNYVNSAIAAIQSQHSTVYIDVYTSVNDIPEVYRPYVNNDVLTLNISPEVCPGLSVKKGVLIVPTRKNGLPVDIPVPFGNIIFIRDKGMNVRIGTQVMIEIKNAMIDDVTPKQRPKFGVVDGGLSSPEE